MNTISSKEVSLVKAVDTSFEILEIIPESAIIVDLYGWITHSNVQLENLFGYTPDELQGKHFNLLMPECHHTQLLNVIEQIRKSPRNQATGIDKFIYGVHKNGTQIPIELKLGSHTTEQGTFVIALIADGTERYWTQAHLREREDRLGIILESTKAIPWAADPVGLKFTYVGPQAVEILGYPMEQWYEKDFWISKIHPDDRVNAIHRCADFSKTQSDFGVNFRVQLNRANQICHHKNHRLNDPHHRGGG